MINTRQLDQTILREYDIRDIVGDTLNPDDVRAIGNGFGTFVVRDGGKSVAVGYDGRLSSPELRFDCPEERKFQIVEEVAERLKLISGITIHDMDGVRVQSDDGWWLLRVCNTQGVLVARCVSTNEEGLKRLKEVFSEQLRASGLEPPAFD